MAESGFDDIEMRNKKLREEEEEEEEDKEAETKFSDDEDPWGIGDYPENFGEGSPKMKFNTVDIPDVKKDAGGIRKSITEDKKKYFKKIFDIEIVKKKGPNSQDLIENTYFLGEKSVKIFYKGKQIGSVIDEKPEFYTRKNLRLVEEFKDRLEKAKKEYEKTLDFTINQQMEKQHFEYWDSYEWDPYERNFFIEEIKQNSIERLNNSIENIQKNMKEIEMDEQDVRELNGVLDPRGQTAEEKIDFLDIQADHWRQKALLETDERKEKWYKDAEKTARLVADKIRLENDVRPEEEETVSIIQQEIEESDMGRFEKFKKWAKENLLGLSAVSISVAGILTTIIIGARNALKSGAKAVGNLGKAIANIGKNFGAVISSLLNLIGSILSWGAKGITFLAKNLWILTLAITYFLKQ